MICDEKKHVRELGWWRILKARSTEAPNSGIRIFKVPSIKFEKETYVDLVKWQTINITEPLGTKHLDCDTFKHFISTEDKLENIPEFLCHSHAVGRMVEMVTEASLAISGVKARKGYIKTNLLSRRKMQKFETKHQFNM